MRAPLFTKQNAAEMGRRGAIAKAEREKANREELARLSAVATDDSRAEKTREHLAKIDALTDQAFAAGNLIRVKVLADIKKTLWPLVTPTAGAMKPRSKDSRRQAPVAI